jgi:hypothetical protein
MRSKNPGLALLQEKVDELDLRREVEDELSQILIEHKIATLRPYTGRVSEAIQFSQPMIAQIEPGRLQFDGENLGQDRVLGARFKIDFAPRGTAERGPSKRMGAMPRTIIDSNLCIGQEKTAG